jgi:hypothetical protein
VFLAYSFYHKMNTKAIICDLSLPLCVLQQIYVFLSNNYKFQATNINK